MVEFVLLDDAEYAHRSRVTAHAGRHRRLREYPVGVVDRHPLLFDRDRDDEGTLRLGAGLLLSHVLLGFGYRALARVRPLHRRLLWPIVIGAVGVVRPKQ